MLKTVVALCLLGAVLAGPPVSRSRKDIQEFRDFLEATRTERGVRVPNAHGSPWENSGKYQGDILLDDVQVESMIQQYSSGRNAYIFPNTKWPNRVVVWDYAAGSFDRAQRDANDYAISILEDRTCIRFRRRTNSDRNYVLLTGKSDGCYAVVGFWSGRGVHDMNLTPSRPGTGCFEFTTIVHEWLHIIGFFHMHSTHDRDSYVRINYNNIVKGMEYAFDRYSAIEVSNVGLGYEYDSAMHYGPYAFSANGRTTIDALRSHTGVMGQSDYVTSYDFWRVDRHYGCAAWKTPKDYKPFYVSDIPDMFKNVAEEHDENTDELDEKTDELDIQ